MIGDLLQHELDFTKMRVRFEVWLQDQGQLYVMGEAYRPPAMAELYAKQGKGIKHSLHSDKLAVDLLFFAQDGTYLTDSEDYRKAGEYWESIGGSWGGRFGDGNHFSLAYGGRK